MEQIKPASVGCSRRFRHSLQLCEARSNGFPHFRRHVPECFVGTIKIKCLPPIGKNDGDTL